MTRQKYATKEELEDEAEISWNNEKVIIAMLSLVALILIMLAWAFDQNTVDVKARSLLAAQYNFTESECVSVDNVTYNYCLRIYDHNYPQDVYACNKHCSIYCHTTQIPDGQDCKTEEKSVITNAIIGWKAYSSNYYTYSCYLSENKNCSGQYVSDYLWNKIHDTVIRTQNIVIPQEELLNVTTCTPIYRNITIFCVTKNDIEKVMELVK